MFDFIDLIDLKACTPFDESTYAIKLTRTCTMLEGTIMEFNQNATIMEKTTNNIVRPIEIAPPSS